MENCGTVNGRELWKVGRWQNDGAKGGQNWKAKKKSVRVGKEKSGERQPIITFGHQLGKYWKANWKAPPAPAPSAF